MTRGIFVFGFMAGIAMRSFADLGVSFAFVFLAVSAVLYATEYIYKRFLSKDLRLALVAFSIFSFSLGMLWYDFMAPASTMIAEIRDGQAMRFTGVVSAEPTEKEKNVELVLDAEVESGQLGNAVSKLDFKILMKTAKFPKFEYGDKLEIFGNVAKPKNFEDSGFDYVTYLAKDGIFFVSENPKIKLVSKGNGSFLNKTLFDIKNSFTDGIKEIFGEPESSLLAGILIGAKESLGKDWLDKFRVAGLSHIIVLSGYNMTIIADGVIKVLAFAFSKGMSMFVGSIAVVLFAIMTGGGASTARAAIMSLIIMISRATGRMYVATQALVFAAFIMILQNPMLLVFDLSFQLSFLATLGLIYITPILEEKLTFLPEKFQFRGMVATTLGALFATTPIIVYKMGTFSLVALPANILVIAFIPATMFFGFLAVVFNFISFYLALPLIAVANSLLSYELFVTDFFASLPYSSFAVSNVSFVAVSMVYFAIILYVINYEFRKVKK